MPCSRCSRVLLPSFLPSSRLHQIFNQPSLSICGRKATSLPPCCLPLPPSLPLCRHPFLLCSCISREGEFAIPVTPLLLSSSSSSSFVEFAHQRVRYCCLRCLFIGFPCSSLQSATPLSRFASLPSSSIKLRREGKQVEKSETRLPLYFLDSDARFVAPSWRKIFQHARDTPWALFCAVRGLKAAEHFKF